MALEIRDVIDSGDLDEQIKDSVTRTHAGTPDPTDKENHELAVENGQAIWKPMRVTPRPTLGEVMAIAEGATGGADWRRMRAISLVWVVVSYWG